MPRKIPTKKAVERKRFDLKLPEINWQLPKRWRRYAIAAPVLAMIGLIGAYVPYLDYLAEKDVRAEICAEASAARELSSLLASAEPFNMMDHHMLNTVTLVGDVRVQNRPVMDLPIVYDGVQMPLRQHPALIRITTRDKAQEMLGHTIANSLESQFCEDTPPWSPHRAFIALWSSDDAPVYSRPEGQEMAEAG